MSQSLCIFASLASFLPDLLSGLSEGARHVLLYSFFKVGALAITPLFLLKAVIFLVVLTLASRLFERFVVSRALKHVSLSDSLKFALGRFITYAILLGGLFIGIQSLGVNLNSLVVFGGALGVGVGLGLQNVVSNFVAGLILLIEQPIRMGDRIEVKDTFGDVVRIGARSTWVRTNDNFVIILPNSDFINNSVINWTANDARIRLNIPVGVGYNSQPEQIRELLLQAAASHPAVLKGPAPDVIFNDFGDSSLDFTLRVWTESQLHVPANLKSDLYFAIFRIMADNHVELPFPQRDLHIRSSDIPLPYPQQAPPAPTRTPGSTPSL
jgi:small-conductance mechanosensitive channel